MSTQGTNPIKLIATLVIDYLRWTQLTPMLTVWGFGLLMLAALLFVNNQEQTFDTIFAVLEWIAGLPVIGDRFTAWMESQAGNDGTISLGGSDLKAAALKAWSLISLVFMLIALSVSWIFGPFKPWSLKRKLGITALCCGALLAAFISLYFANPEEFNGPFENWLLTFGGIALILFVVSAWCLSIAHLLGHWSRAIGRSTLGVRGESKPLPVSGRN